MSEQPSWLLDQLEKKMLKRGDILPPAADIPYKAMVSASFSVIRIDEKLDRIVPIKGDIDRMTVDGMLHPKKWVMIAEYLQLVEQGLDAFISQHIDKEANE